MRSALTVITSILLARSLGPSEFGQFGFLLASFTALTQLLDMGSSNAFLTFISKKIRSKLYLLYYCGWLAIQFFAMFLFIIVLAPDYVIQQIWLGESRFIISLAFVAVFFQQNVWLTISRLGESQRLTGIVQLLSVGVGIAHLILVGILLYLDSISITLLFQIIAIEIVIALLIAMYIFPLQFASQTEPFSKILKNYRHYCAPLIPMTWIALIAAFFDTWFLQLYGGSKEQAYYSMASQFSVISLIATRSFLNILWKEIAEAYGNENLEAVRSLFLRSTKNLFYLGAFISGFFIPWTSDVIRLTLGDAFLPGVLTMSIMFLYPVDQARGQVAGTMLLAMEQTRITFIIGAISSIIGVIMTYLMLAPHNAYIPGLELGSTGLSIKMFIVQLITVNISLWWLSKKLEMKMEWFYQFIGFGFFLSIGYVNYLFITIFSILDEYILIGFLMAGISYVCAVLFVVNYVPSIIGFSFEDMNNIKKSLGSLYTKIRRRV